MYFPESTGSENTYRQFENSHQFSFESWSNEFLPLKELCIKNTKSIHEDGKYIRT